jgi:hypothetical protein
MESYKHVFYHKSPDVYYISEGNYVGRVTNYVDS